MELLNLWVVAVLLTFTDIPAYESHYQKVTFNNEDSCNEFLDEKRMNLAHDLIFLSKVFLAKYIFLNKQTKT